MELAFAPIHITIIWANLVIHTTPQQLAPLLFTSGARGHSRVNIICTSHSADEHEHNVAGWAFTTWHEGLTFPSSLTSSLVPWVQSPWSWNYCCNSSKYKQADFWPYLDTSEFTKQQFQMGLQCATANNCTNSRVLNTEKGKLRSPGVGWQQEARFAADTCCGPPDLFCQLVVHVLCSLSHGICLPTTNGDS